MCKDIVVEVKVAAVIWAILCGLQAIYMVANLQLLKETPANMTSSKTKKTNQPLQDEGAPKTIRRIVTQTKYYFISPYAKKRRLATVFLIIFLIAGIIGFISSVLLYIYGPIKKSKKYVTYFLYFGVLYLILKIVQAGFDFGLKYFVAGVFGFIGFLILALELAVVWKFKRTLT